MDSGVVSFKRSVGLGLLVAHFFKGGNDGDSRLGIEKQRAGFGFRGRGGNTAERFAKNLVQWMAPLGVGLGGELVVAKGRSVRKTWPPAGLQALGRTR